MLKNYILIAYRNLLNHRVFSAINILGLSIGISCCVLLSLYIKEELSFEKHFKDYQHIYRVTSTFIKDGKGEKLPRTSPPVPMTMLQDFPELESATRVVSPPEVEQHLLTYEDKTFYEKTGYLVDSTFFDMFSYPFAEGDANTALRSPSTVVLSSKVAHKIFGDDSALDKLVIINSGGSTDTFRIAGVLKPFTNRSQLDADFYMCMNSKGWGEYINNVTTWAGQNFIYSFIKVKPQTNVENLVAKFPDLLNKYGAKDLEEMGFKKSMNLQSLQDMHLYSAAEFQSSFGYLDMGTPGNITYVYILSSIGLFILLIACINFMNLTTAKASQRAGEVGVRKSLGATRGNLIRQFLGESIAIVVISMIVSIGLVQIGLPLFNIFTQRNLSIDTQNIIYVVGALAGISLITGFVAGSYPALFLSSFQPARVLKDKRLSGGGSNMLRKSLVVFQFVISITLVSSIIIIQKQMNYIQSKSLGFDPQYKISIPLRTVEAKHGYERLKKQFSDLSGIKGIAGTTALPGSGTFRDLPLYPDGSSMEKATLHYNVSIDERYFDLLNIKMLRGRDLTFEADSFNFGNSTNHIVVNEASLKVSGIDPAEAIGSHLNIDWDGQHMIFEIEGVVEDFHQFSMHRKVAPMIFLIPNEKSDYVEIVASLDGSNYTNIIALMEKTWKEIIPNTPFEHTLLSDNIKLQYEDDQRVHSIITAFTIIAIFISCLGLYGLSIYVAERRVKEIGIRKVLGASTAGIVGMLSKDFVKLVAIAFIIAIPIGYYSMNKWLEGFEYKITLDATVFLLSGAMSFILAWVTIGYESIKAALSNPVESLKIE